MSSEKKTKTMMLEIVTPYRHFYEGPVESVSLSSLNGRVGILPGHAPMVIALTPGIISITVGGVSQYGVLTDGFAEIGQHLLLVLCVSANWPEEIDVQRAVNAYERAKERLTEAPYNSEERYYSENSLRRAVARINAAKQHGNEKQKRLIEKIFRDEEAK
ncbi:MAG: ATP synthase F1 subunit epsilon [Clostridiales bacterium]|nr:ATP synthase F1 subunit epsilon [Clostridiales bacterium]